MGPCPLSRLPRGRQVLGMPSLQAEAGQLLLSTQTPGTCCSRSAQGTDVHTPHGTTAQLSPAEDQAQRPEVWTFPGVRHLPSPEPDPLLPVHVTAADHRRPAGTSLFSQQARLAIAPALHHNRPGSSLGSIIFFSTAAPQPVACPRHVGPYPTSPRWTTLSCSSLC